MAALPNSQPGVDTTHLYHADAYILDANVEEPVHTDLKRQVLVELPDNGNIQYEKAIPYQLKGILSYTGGYSQVSGHKNTKAAGGFTTVTTSVVEGLNVLDVVTADRVVGQISTTHPPYDPKSGLTDSVPSVTFLGTRFENLKIDGHEVKPERRLDILGPKPPNASSYLQDKGVLARIDGQYETLNSVVLPDWARERYRRDRAGVQRIDEHSSAIDCSIVGAVPKAPGTSFGHVIDLPHFGKIFLGELKVRRELGQPATPQSDQSPDRYTFHLTMIRLEMGCLAKGTAKIVALDSNGTGSKGGGH